MEQKEEIFVIDHANGKKLIYAPLRKRLVVANEDVVNIVHDYCQNQTIDQSSAQGRILEVLTKEGVLGGATPEWPTHPDHYEFCPHEVTLFLTSRCNLNCRYCYAEAGKKNIDMPWEVARAGIDLVAANAGILGNDSFAVGFHGGGEPTVAWPLFVECCEYAKQVAEQKGLNLELFSATNGVLDPGKREYITHNLKTVNISLDGPEDIQNYNRPMPSGAGSYAAIRDTLEYFDKLEFFYGIRSTITDSNVARMEEIAEHICKTFRPAYLHLEPAWFCGRCLSTHEVPPEDDAFVRGFLRAQAIGDEYGVNVHYSGARLDVLTSKFCGAPGDSFTVLPEGIVTSCYEVTEMTDPRAAMFHYGKYDPSTGSFHFNDERIESLKKLSVDHIPFCEDCFCRWHCAGDCIAKAFKADLTQHNGTERCTINRKLLSAALFELIESSVNAEGVYAIKGEVTP